MTTSGSHYKAVPVGADSTVAIQGSRIGGFVPTATGTWTFTIVQENMADVTLAGITVPAGNVGLFHELPIHVGTTGRSSVTTSAGGAGILLSS
jgi:hypothetical protein